MTYIPNNNPFFPENITNLPWIQPGRFYPSNQPPKPIDAKEILENYYKHVAKRTDQYEILEDHIVINVPGHAEVFVYYSDLDHSIKITTKEDELLLNIELPDFKLPERAELYHGLLKVHLKKFVREYVPIHVSNLNINR